MSGPGIESVSDTALWVANYRAEETSRADALFRDPLASELVGRRGAELSRRIPYGKVMAWVVAVRTVAIDRLILRAVSEGATTVLNLGAGLDTRPYRMKLPRELTWIEADFGKLIEAKERFLAGKAPACRVERVGIDLLDRSARRKLFADVDRRSKSLLVLTEGVLPYLTHEQASELADDLRAMGSLSSWIQDFRDGGYAKSIPPGFGKALGAAPLIFDPTDWLGFFTARGWRIEEELRAGRESERIGRPFPSVFPWNLIAWMIPKRKHEQFRNASGYALLTPVR